ADNVQLAADTIDPARLAEEPTPAKIHQALADGISEDDLETVGKHLVSLLGTVGETWAAVRKQQAADTVVRTALAIQPHDLQLLPWESAIVDGSFAFREASNPIYRAATPKSAQTPRPDPLPLRVLVVIGGDDPQEPDALGWQNELRALRAIFRAQREHIDAEVLICPTPDVLTSTCALFRPHVFHFIGHGVQAGNQTALALFIDGQLYEWRIAALIPELESLPPVRFAFINACRTAEAAEGTYDLGRMFIERLGACSAVTMLGNVLGEAAAAFSKGLYEGLVTSAPIDRIIAKARNGMGRNFGSDWTMPILHLACAPGDVLPKTFHQNVPPMQAVRTEFVDIRSFVDRRDERRLVAVQLTEPAKDQPEPKHLVVTMGSQGVGKTALARWITRHLSLRGQEVRYVDFSDEHSKSFADVLDRIRNGDKKNACGRGPLPPQHFVKFDAALAAYRADNIKTEEFIEELFGHFVDGLAALTAEQPLVLVLDHFRIDGHESGVIETHFSKYLRPLLFDGIAGGRVKGLTMLVVLAGKWDAEPLETLLGSAHSCTVSQWPRTHYKLLACEYGSDYADAEFVEGLVELMAGRAPDPWSPKALHQLRDVLKAAEQQ
ncbi:MAG: CHAT domain-containing protein, partial [Thermoanaerobaculia bacterium]